MWNLVLLEYGEEEASSHVEKLQGPLMEIFALSFRALIPFPFDSGSINHEWTFRGNQLRRKWEACHFLDCSLRGLDFTLGTHASGNGK